jgi:hypothetical protein
MPVLIKAVEASVRTAPAITPESNWRCARQGSARRMSAQSKSTPRKKPPPSAPRLLPLATDAEQARPAHDPGQHALERRPCGHGDLRDFAVMRLTSTSTPCWVPKAGQRLRCSSCGGKRVLTRPAWHSSPRPGTLDFRPHEERRSRQPQDLIRTREKGRCHTNLDRRGAGFGRLADLTPWWRLATSGTLRLLGREACGGM